MADNEIAKSKSWIWGWFGRYSWSGSSPTMLRAAEKKILSCLKTAYRGWYVDIGPVVGPANKIWTISLNEESPKTPIVLLHGLGAGVALWSLNLDALAAQRPVYAIDILGFGRSSRPVFSKEAREVEDQLVSSVEEWRREMQLEKFVLLGHSMGGFLAASYAIKYPQRIKHLIFADPWGFQEPPKNLANTSNLPFPLKAMVYLIESMNPLAAVRGAGPFGQWLISATRPDIIRNFSPIIKDDLSVVSQYIHQCNAQSPTGESAFWAMMQLIGFAKNPMIRRIGKLDPEIPITFIYGSRSWIDNAPGVDIKQTRTDSYVNVQVISGAGHHVYAEKSDIFNKHVLEACELSDNISKLTSLSSIKIALKTDDQQSIEEEDKEMQTIDGEESNISQPRSTS